MIRKKCGFEVCECVVVVGFVVVVVVVVFVVVIIIYLVTVGTMAAFSPQ